LEEKRGVHRHCGMKTKYNIRIGNASVEAALFLNLLMNSYEECLQQLLYGFRNLIFDIYWISIG